MSTTTVPFSACTYTSALADFLAHFDWSPVDRLAERLLKLWSEDRQLFLCGNGGSAANALHLANDFLYGIAPSSRAIRVDCLCANPAILTCLGNDTGFDNIFAQQLRTKALPGDGLIVLSGSGNSANILHAIRVAHEMGLWTCGILGFKGGAAIHLVDEVIHFPLDDMEMSEDLQVIVGHSLKRILRERTQEHAIA